MGLQAEVKNKRTNGMDVQGGCKESKRNVEGEDDVTKRRKVGAQEMEQKSKQEGGDERAPRIARNKEITSCKEKMTKVMEIQVQAVRGQHLPDPFVHRAEMH